MLSMWLNSWLCWQQPSQMQKGVPAKKDTPQQPAHYTLAAGQEVCQGCGFVVLAWVPHQK